MNRSRSGSDGSPLTAHRLRAFTILELLVVISIIAILVGLIIPTFGKSREKAKVAKAKVTVKGLEMACNEYFNQYKCWPKANPSDERYSFGGPEDSGKEIFKNLRGDQDAPNNPSRIAFFDFGNPPESVTGTEDKKACYDPWSYDRGSSTMTYKVIFDVDLNNRITAPNGDEVYKNVLVWSVGTNRSDTAPPAVTSWE